MQVIHWNIYLFIGASRSIDSSLRGLSFARCMLYHILVRLLRPTLMKHSLDIAAFHSNQGFIRQSSGCELAFLHARNNPWLIVQLFHVVVEREGLAVTLYLQFIVWSLEYI